MENEVTKEGLLICLEAEREDHDQTKAELKAALKMDSASPRTSFLPVSEAERRYHHDAQFRTLVDFMQGYLHTNEMTSYDMARAAVLACELHARRNMAPIVVVLKEGGE